MVRNDHAMKKAQIAVLSVALLSGGLAWWLMSGSKAPPPTVTQVVAAAPSVKTVGVLVAQRDMPMGTLTAAADFRWQEWPAETVPASAIRRDAGATNVPDEVIGAITRAPIVANELISKEKILKMQGSGFMSALLPQGYRAVAITIDASGSSTAGGFILPNDRVDVVRVMRDENGRNNNEYVSETILENVRVLAIGKDLTDKSASGNAAGATTATLELSPRQVEQVVSAQRMGGGSLTLALRSALDLNRKEDEDEARQLGLQIVRFGQSASR